MGSTSNALDKGGDNFKKLYIIQMLQKEIEMDRLALDSISLFIPMEWNYEGFIDTYGLPVFVDKIQSKDRWFEITTGVIEHWQNEVEGLKEIKML